MSDAYRIVHFIPDPFSGGRVPVGALVRSENRVRAVVAPHLPSAECLGSRETAELLTMLLADLRGVDAFRSLPATLGPHLVLDDERPLPSRLELAPEVWVRDQVLPAGLPPESVTQVREPQRATQGYRFFETHKVDRYVKKRFQPERDWQRYFGTPAPNYRPVSHWVAGRTELLLLEPVVVHRGKFEEDLRTVATTLSAYRSELPKPNGTRGAVYAYILPGGREDEREHARESLQRVAHVIDTAVLGERERFVREVKRVGTTGELVQQ